MFYYSMLITYNNNRFQISDFSGLQSVLGKYFNHIMLTTDGDSGAGVALNTKYAAIPFDNPGIVIEYDMNFNVLKFSAK